MANPFFSGRIPQELDEHIKRYCAETGESKTQLLINALSSYLNHPIKPQAPTSISISMFNQLEQRVAEIEKKIEITSVISPDNIINIEKQNDKDSDNKIDNDASTAIEPVFNPVNTDIISSDKFNINFVISESLEELDEAQAQIPTLKTKEQNGSRRILPTNVIPSLPGLEGMDAKKIITKLRNSRNTNKSSVELGQYIFKYHGKEPGAKGALLWEVITLDNNP